MPKSCSQPDRLFGYPVYMRPTQSSPTQSSEQLDSGRRGYREPHEPPDGVRPCIHHGLFWTDQQERATYEHAVQSNPIRQDEGRGSYTVRIAALVAGRYAKVGTMLRARLSPVLAGPEQAQALLVLTGSDGE